MLIKKDTKLIVHHKRKGMFRAQAVEDFDTETTEFYPVVTLETVYGMATEWGPGERIECRRDLCTVARIMPEAQEDE